MTEPPRPLATAELRAAKPDRHAFRALPRRPIRVVLDGVRQGYNQGSLFRLCDALLLERLVLCDAAVELRGRKLVQAARGSQHWVPWETRATALEAVTEARAAGYAVLAVELTADAVAPEALRLRFPVCVVFGAERAGLSPEVVAVADAAVAIPVLGMANSLNVATAAAIVLHQLTLRLAEAGPAGSVSA